MSVGQAKQSPLPRNRFPWRLADWQIAVGIATIYTLCLARPGLIAFAFDWNVPASSGALRAWGFQELFVPVPRSYGWWPAFPSEMFLKTAFGFLGQLGINGSIAEDLFLFAWSSVAVYGVLRLGRELNARRDAAILVGAFWLVVPWSYNALSLGYITFLFAAAVLPWLLLTALRAARTGGARDLYLLASLVALAATQLQFVVFALLLTAAIIALSSARIQGTIKIFSVYVLSLIVTDAFVWVPFALRWSLQDAPTSNKTWVLAQEPTLTSVLGYQLNDYAIHDVLLGPLGLAFHLAAMLLVLGVVWRLAREPARYKAALALLALVLLWAISLSPGPLYDLRVGIYRSVYGAGLFRNLNYITYLFWCLIVVFGLASLRTRPWALALATLILWIPFLDGGAAKSLNRVAIPATAEVPRDGRLRLVLPRPAPVSFDGNKSAGIDVLAVDDTLPPFVTASSLGPFQATLLAQYLSRGESPDVLSGSAALGGLERVAIIRSIKSPFALYLPAQFDFALPTQLSTANLLQRAAESPALRSVGPRTYGSEFAFRRGGMVRRCDVVIGFDGDYRAAATLAQSEPGACIAPPQSDLPLVTQYGLYPRSRVCWFQSASSLIFSIDADANAGWVDVIGDQWWWYDSRMTSGSDVIFSKIGGRLTLQLPGTSGSIFVRLLSWPRGPRRLTWQLGSRRGAVRVPEVADGNYFDLFLAAKPAGRSTMTLIAPENQTAIAGFGIATAVDRKPPETAGLVVEQLNPGNTINLGVHPALVLAKLVGLRGVRRVELVRRHYGKSVIEFARPFGVGIQFGNRISPLEYRQISPQVGLAGSAPSPSTRGEVVSVENSRLRGLSIPTDWSIAPGIPFRGAGTFRVKGLSSTLLTSPREWIPEEVGVTGNDGSFSADYNARLVRFQSQSGAVYDLHTPVFALSAGLHRLALHVSECSGLHHPAIASLYDETQKAHLITESIPSCPALVFGVVQTPANHTYRMYVYAMTGKGERGILSLGSLSVADYATAAAVFLSPRARSGTTGVQYNQQYRDEYAGSSGEHIPSFAGMNLWIGPAPGKLQPPSFPPSRAYRLLVVIAWIALVLPILLFTVLRWRERLEAQ